MTIRAGTDQAADKYDIKFQIENDIKTISRKNGNRSTNFTSKEMELVIES